MASSSRSALYTLQTLARSLPGATPAASALLSAATTTTTTTSSSSSRRQQQLYGQVRHASFSGSFLRNLIPRRRAKRDDDNGQQQVASSDATAVLAPKAEAEAPKGLFDTVTEDEDVLQTQQRSGLVARPPKPATFVSTPPPIFSLPLSDAVSNTGC